MEDNVCQERHKAVDEKIDRHEKWLGEHDEKIDVLNKSDAKKDAIIENLCKQMSGLTKAIWGLIATLVGILVENFVSK